MRHDNARRVPALKDQIERPVAAPLPPPAISNAKGQVSFPNGLFLPDWRTRTVANIAATKDDRDLTKIAVGRFQPFKTSC